MTNRALNLDDTLYQYLRDDSLREHPVQAELRAATRKHPLARMQISPEQGQFMALLINLIGARKTLEIGVFTFFLGFLEFLDVLLVVVNHHFDEFAIKGGAGELG